MGRPRIIASLLFSFLILSLFCAHSQAEQSSPFRLSGPFIKENLAVYLVHGEDQLTGEEVLTLDEALRKEIVVVHETGAVNELAVENLSKDKSVFIQAGDIVKGGKQDRTLSQDLLLKPLSGKVAIDSFCVEQGRWQPRGSESAARFASSDKRISSKALKLAVRSKNQQGKVWQEVAEVQRKLSKNLAAPVKSASSATSLQLTLESEAVERTLDGYRAALREISAKRQDSIGYLFLINGELNSADVYGSHALFTKVWPKLLDAAATEALAEKDAAAKPLAATEAELLAFLQRAGSAPEKSGDGSAPYREGADTVLYETKSAYGKAIHRQYLKK